ncbi:UNVERIFIED_CONTAM: hypothetical protein Cloal_3425 [Acetivibrio alkalicellulosi]
MERINSQDRATAGNVVLIIIGWISAIMSLFMYPFIFGFLGVVMGIMATKSGSRAGLSVIVASIILMATGLIFSGAILNYTRHLLGL